MERNLISFGGMAALLVIAFLLSSTMATAFALISFWSTKSANLYMLWWGAGAFLSGWIAPLAVLPDGLRTAAEVFADRAYTDAATLVPRSQPGAVLHDDDAVVAHVLRMLDAGGIVAASGKVLKTPMHSICVHGDTPGAVANARRLREVLKDRGAELATLPQVLA